MRYVTKEFLSPAADESGSIVCTIKTAQIKDFQRWTVASGGTINGSVRIADCSEHVILDFHAEGQRNFEKRLTKLDKLISELQNMRHQYVAQWENHQRDLAFYKQREGIKDEAA